jgi:hypothetical protein
MRRQICGLLVPALAVLVASAIGCGGGPTLKTEYVEGVVTLDGTPVEGATVMFQPVNPEQGMSANGFTDANGVYKLTALGTAEEQAEAEAGTLPGEYYVAVQKQFVETGISEEEAEEQGIEFDPNASREEQKVEYLVPEKYKIAAKSGLKYTVKEGENKINIELTSD